MQVPRKFTVELGKSEKAQIANSGTVLSGHLRCGKWKATGVCALEAELFKLKTGTFFQ